MSKSILLIGCTGFLGKCILYKLLKTTDYNISLIIRNKNGISYKNRIPIILEEIQCHEEKYIQRITPINISYIRDQHMKINICDEDKTYILKHINYVLTYLQILFCYIQKHHCILYNLL